MTNGLFLDDMRVPTDVTWVKYPSGIDWKIVRNCEEFKDYITKHGIPQFITFDHDLGDEEPLSVAGLAEWLCHEVVEGRVQLPENFHYFVHSMNPVGGLNIHSKLDQLVRFMRK